MKQWTRVGVYGLCLSDHHILLARIAPHISEAQKWTLPGGGLDFGEDPRCALIREIYEETGLRGDPGEVVDVRSQVFTRPEGEIHAVQIICRVELAGDPRVTEVGGSVDLSRWVGLVAAPELQLVSLARHALKLVRS